MVPCHPGPVRHRRIHPPHRVRAALWRAVLWVLARHTRNWEWVVGEYDAEQRDDGDDGGDMDDLGQEKILVTDADF